MCSAEAAMSPMTAYSQYSQGKANQQYYNYLADQSDKQADEVDKSTQEQLSVISADSGREIADLRKNTDQTISSQRAAMAANGVYSDSGTAGDIIGDTVDKMALDEAAIKYNADQAAWQTKRQSINTKLGYAAQSTSYRVQGSNARAAGNIGAITTLTSGAVSGAIAYGKAGA